MQARRVEGTLEATGWGSDELREADRMQRSLSGSEGNPWWG